jgi:hypothetical protein
MMNAPRDDRDEDVENIVSMEHVNLHITDQATATLFYVIGLGLTRDPYMWVGLENMWINVGEQQFHLPTGGRAHLIPGHIGLVVPDLGELETRLKAAQDQLAGTRFAWSLNADHINITCPWGNQFRCYAPAPNFGDMILGIPYVEFKVKPGAASGIARFYGEVIQAPSAMEGDGAVARVKIGRNQWLSFREIEAEIPPYDGHHIAVYVADFSGPYEFLKHHSLISEEVAGHQFRFQKLVDPSNGEQVFELEHEVRSLRHPMYHRPLINRNPMQTQRGYLRGHDALNPFQR